METHLAPFLGGALGFKGIDLQGSIGLYTVI